MHHRGAALHCIRPSRSQGGHVPRRSWCTLRSFSWRGAALHPPLEFPGRPAPSPTTAGRRDSVGPPFPLLAPSPSGTKSGRRVQGGARRDPIRVSIWMSSAQLLRGRWSSTWPLRAARMGSAGPAGLQGGGGGVCRGMLLSRCALHLGPVPGRGVKGRGRAAMIRADTHAAVSTVPSGTKPGRRVQEGPLRYPMRVLSRPPSWPLRAAPMGSAVLFGS